jgi:hypothetical protein
VAVVNIVLVIVDVEVAVTVDVTVSVVVTAEVLVVEHICGGMVGSGRVGSVIDVEVDDVVDVQSIRGQKV